MKLKTKQLDPTFRRNFIQDLENRLIETARRGETPEYIDTILTMCEFYELEPEVVSGIIPLTIKNKIEDEARGRNMLPKKSVIALDI